MTVQTRMTCRAREGLRALGFKALLQADGC
jgi:hypothetical protein